MASTDAQAVWKELSEHMKTSSKGASEKRRLTQYVTNTILDDNFKGTTEQFVLHFNEQFRQLEEISEDDERLPSSVKLTLLQTAVRSINDLRIVETLDEFQSTTHGHGSSTSLSFDTYYDLLINACVRYDKTKKANIGKRRNVYATNMDDTYVDLPTACIDDVPDSPYGGIDLPPDEFYQVHALSSRHPPPQRPGQPTRPPFRPPSQNSRPTNPIRRYDGPIFLPPQIYRILSEDALKALKAYNTEAISRFHKRKVHNTEIVEEPQDDPPGPPVSENDLPDLPESDLNIPDDPILDFVNNQCHSSEDLDQALQAYQAFQIPSPQDSTMTPERTINHHFTYHIAQASQAKHGSLVDRGANGGLAGSDVRILSRSSRKCTVTGISDSAKTEISNKVMDILRAYHISNWHSEPYHQNQNPAEWRYRTIKSWTNTVMNRSGAPANCWLLCLIYVCYLLNHIACTALDGKIPLLALTGITPDISIILLFTFYQPVFYATYDQHFPSESEERAGYWVGFGEHCGDAMTHKILDQDTQKIIYRSAVRPKKSSTPNHRLAPHGGEVSTSSDPSEDKISSGSPTGAPEGSSPEQKAPTVFIRSRDEENPSGSKPMPTFDPSDLIGRTFLLPPEENGERHRAKVTRKVVEIIDQEDGKRVENINFILDIGNGKVEELISYNQLLEHLENAQDHDMGMDQELFKFRAIIGHQGPLLASDPDWKGSKYNVQVEWETGEITFEPLSIIAADDPVTCAAYAKEKDLLALEGWRRFRSLAKKDKVLARAIKQSKIRQVRRSQTYMFGYLIPRNYMEAMQFDSENKNSKWYDAIKLEMESMAEYKVFKKWDKAILDKHKKVNNPPKGYHRIKVHLVFAVKFDGRHKARLVADGHLTPEPIENIYSGVVSLRNLRLVIFLGKLNNLELWGADIGNAYLEAFTDEKLYIVAGPEFQELEGYILIFLKALYGLKSSGKRWAEVIHGILRDMKFLPSKADPCIWLRKAPNLRCYEYIAVYVDDLCIAAESPSAIIQIFKSKYHLKVKGDGKLTYHLGADYFEDPDGTFVSQPKKYIDKLADTYKRLFNEDPPKGYKTPLDKNDHPELDTSEILEGDMAAKYLTMVGQLQWLVTLGRFDIHAQVATMSRFRAAPRQGHMDRLKRIYSYAIRTKDYAIRFRTEKPDYSFLPDQDFDWTYSVYGDVHESLPDDMPEPLGESVTTTTTMDANLNHCLATGKSLAGCLHFVNKTPVDWYSKKQATVETATYGSEFVAPKTATEQIMDIRQTLRYLGAPITTKSFLFGDNRSVVTSTTLPHSTLTKRHNILAFHRVREAIAAKLMAFYWIQSAYNLSDMLSKHWDHPSVYPMVLKLLITRGNITLIPREATQEKEKEILNPQKENLKIKEKQN